MDMYKPSYKSTINPQYWMQQLGRNLTKKEKYLLMSVRQEKMMNDSICNIYNFATEQKLYTPALTQLSGNCFFESLKILGVCNNVMDFRTGLGMLMFYFRDIKNFIHGQELSIFEMFQFINDIDSVFCHKTKKFYKYNYDTMCIDLMSEGEWTRLPTELIIMVISSFLNIKVRIFHDNGHITEINSAENPTRCVNIGLIGEVHYIPLTERHGAPHENNIVRYTNALKNFHQWAERMMDDSDASESDGFDSDNEETHTNGRQNMFVSKV